MEMEGKIYTVWGAQGPPKVFCAKSARWFNSKRGKSPVRPLAVFGQSSWVNREVYTYSKVFTHLMNDTMKPLDHQPLSKPIQYRLYCTRYLGSFPPKKLPGDFLSKGRWTSSDHVNFRPPLTGPPKWPRCAGVTMRWAGRKPRFPHASRRVFTYDYVSRGDESSWKHERQSSWKSSKLALSI